MAIVLCKAPYAQQAMQAARGFIAVAGAEFTVAQRQVPVRAQPRIKNLNMAGTIHGLNRIVPVLRGGGKHVVFVVLPVPRSLPE